MPNRWLLAVCVAVLSFAPQTLAQSSDSEGQTMRPVIRGRQAAVADFHGLMVHGALAWWLWGGAHVLFLIGGRNRTTVLINWIWAYLTYRRASRLITDRSATL